MNNEHSTSQKSASSPDQGGRFAWNWAVPLALILVIGVGALTTFWLYRIAGTDSAARIEAIRTGTTIAFGLGGLCTLLLFARRQWQQEREHRHAVQSAADIQHDAIERRVTELYIKAVEQVDNDKSATAQLAGLYALERLARDYPDHRQAVMNVITAHLRIPPNLWRDKESAPTGALPIEEADGSKHWMYAGEREVRLTAQKVLANILRQYPVKPLDDDHGGTERVDQIDLQGATLFNVGFEDCNFPAVDFRSTTLFGSANFSRAHFSKYARFDAVTCCSTIELAGATFEAGGNFTSGTFFGPVDATDVIAHELLDFNNATFTHDVAFYRSQLEEIRFENAIFHESAAFNGANIGEARFDNAAIASNLELSHTKFTGQLGLRSTCIHGGLYASHAVFEYVCARGARIRDYARFANSHFTHNIKITNVIFFGPTTFEEATFSSYVEFDGTQFRDHVYFVRITVEDDFPLHNVQLLDKASFYKISEVGEGKFDATRMYIRHPRQVHGLGPRWRIVASENGTAYVERADENGDE